MTPKEWLASERNYEVGRQLYEQLGDSDRLKLALARGDNFYNREAVVWEMTKLARAGVTATVALAVPVPVVVVTNTPETVPSEPAPENPLLAGLREARRPLYDERTQVHAQLEVLAEHGSQDDVHQAALRIMALSRELETSKQAEAYVAEHGQLPPPPAAAPGLDALSPVELLKKRNSLRSQVSRLKKREDRAADLVQAQTDLSLVEALLRHE